LARFIKLSEKYGQGALELRLGPSPERRSYIESARDFAELAAAVEAFLPSNDPVVLDKIRTALAGNVLPRYDANEHARNTQYELLIAATLKRRGFAVTLAEPDVLVGIGTEQVAIAAKRLTSAKRAGDRV